MGCFSVVKGKKKKFERPVRCNSAFARETLQNTLPEPEIPGRSLQSAPPSFRTRTATPVLTSNSRTRALSAPLTLHAAENDGFSPVEFEGQEDTKVRGGQLNYGQAVNPQPLPLPSPHNSGPLKNWGSFKSVNTSGPLYSSGPLPRPPVGSLRCFAYEEIATACQNFIPERCISEGLSTSFYRASLGDDASGVKKLEATVCLLMLPETRGYKEFVNEINTLASLQHPHICKLLGYHAREGSDKKIVVFERLFHGSLDRLLYVRSDGPPMDWYARMKVALCAAQGLAFLHEEGPFQAMFYEFSSTNIQIDKDFCAKLSGYGCISHCSDVNFPSSSLAAANLPAETKERGLLTPKSNVWSFGVILLELLTGRKHMDSKYAKEEGNLIKWSRPFISDDSRLSLIMDPRLKGRYPTKAARTVADVAQKCVRNDPSERPTMGRVVDSLKDIQDMKYPSKFPLQEPALVVGKQMLRSPSLNAMPSPIPIPPIPIPIPIPSNFSPPSISTLMVQDHKEIGF